MTLYPGDIDEFRTVQNLPGILYNATDTKTVFAEDTNDHSSSIIAIQTVLGINPAADFDTVSDRIAAAGGGGVNNLDGGVANTDYGTITAIDGGIA